MCCLIVVAIIMGFGKAYSLGEDLKVTIWKASHKGMGTIFMVGVGPSIQHGKMLIWQLGEV